MMGKKCPYCGKQTFHDEGPHHRCKKCGVLGWAWHQPVKNVGSGLGKKCPGCEQQTLHKVFGSKRLTVRRCSTCNFTTVRPKRLRPATARA
jgi:Zn ribbon nucleic-acid-binding protein